MRLLQIAVLCLAWMLLSAPKSEAATWTYIPEGYCYSSNIIGSQCFSNTNRSVTGSIDISDQGFVTFVQFYNVGIAPPVGSRGGCASETYEGGGRSVCVSSISLENFTYGGGELYRHIGWYSTGRIQVIAPVPVPAALPLFAAVLTGLGFIAWRRQRQYGS